MMFSSWTQSLPFTYCCSSEAYCAVVDARQMSPTSAQVCQHFVNISEAAMAWTMERAERHGKARFLGMYRDLSGRRRSAGTFATEKKALTAAAHAERIAAAGRIGDPRSGRQTLRGYVTGEWFPHHVIEAKTRENYTYLLNRYILPELGDRRIAEILPIHIREWVLRLQNVHQARPPTIREAKVVLDAVFTTALNDQVTVLHPGKGVKTPPVARKPKKIITSEQFDELYAAIADPTMRLLVEVDIESGLRWGELTELRARDFEAATGMLTVARAVVHLQAKEVPAHQRFVVKNYPKDKEWRQIQLPGQVAANVARHIRQCALGPDDLLFRMPTSEGPARRSRPEALPDPDTLGLTEPNENGRQYRHGTPTAYGAGKCRCQPCRDAVAAYRAKRRAEGKDEPRTPRLVTTDGHIPAGWFRRSVWRPALAASGISTHITPHGMRHAHASWLLAGGADLQVVKERLGHGSITTTEKYLHTLPGAHDAAIAALDAVRGRTANTSTAHEPKPDDAGPDARDVELERLRAMVDQFRSLLGQSPGA
jgi:integrase